MPVIEQKIADDIVRGISTDQKAAQSPNIPLDYRWRTIGSKNPIYVLGTGCFSKVCRAELMFSRLGALAGYLMIEGQLISEGDTTPQIEKDDIVEAYQIFVTDQQRTTTDTGDLLDCAWREIIDSNMIYTALTDYFALVHRTELRQTRFGALVGYRLFESCLKRRK